MMSQLNLQLYSFAPKHSSGLEQIEIRLNVAPRVWMFLNFSPTHAKPGICLEFMLSTTFFKNILEQHDIEH